MTSHNNRDNILSDQKLHDLLKAEVEMERLGEFKRDAPTQSELPAEERAEESVL